MDTPNNCFSKFTKENSKPTDSSSEFQQALIHYAPLPQEFQREAKREPVNINNPIIRISPVYTDTQLSAKTSPPAHTFPVTAKTRKLKGN